jgi:hypothetical protein
MTIKKVVLLICAFGTVAFPTLGHPTGKDFHKHNDMAFGRITSVNGGGKGNWRPGINYQYALMGIKINGSIRTASISYNKAHELVDKTLPVLYKKYWYGYVDVVLITPSDFKYYGYVFPDSLK